MSERTEGKHYCTGDGCRACLDALDAPSGTTGPADAPKEPNPCPTCGAFLWSDPRPCWNCARLKLIGKADEMCLLCGEPRAEHLKSPADWRTVPGCMGMFRKVSEPSGTTGPAEAPTEETHMSLGSTVPGDAWSQSLVATWSLIAAAPQRSYGDSPVDVLVWGERLGVRTGRVASYPDGFLFAGVSNVGGNIAEDLVTHWMPLPSPPTLQAQDSQPAQVGQPSNHPAFVAGPVDAGSHETASEALEIVKAIAKWGIIIGPETDEYMATVKRCRELAASASAPAAPRETEIQSSYPGSTARVNSWR